MSSSNLGMHSEVTTKAKGSSGSRKSRHESSRREGRFSRVLSPGRSRMMSPSRSGDRRQDGDDERERDHHQHHHHRTSSSHPHRRSHRTHSRDESRDEASDYQHRSESSRQRASYVPSSPCVSSAISETSSLASPVSTSQASTGKSSKNDMDEAYIQKLLTEGLWSDQPGALEDVLNKVSNLLFTSDEKLKTKRRDAIYRAGGHLAIVQAMKRHGSHKGIQTQGCRALANATWETSEFMQAITAVGGVDVIIGAMQSFAQDEVVQICGSCALRNLSSLLPIAKMIVGHNGLPVVLRAMQTFPMNANIQECGCWTIAHLCLDKGNVKYFQRTSCFGTIGAAADQHSKQPDVLLAARQATERLWNILLK